MSDEVDRNTAADYFNGLVVQQADHFIDHFNGAMKSDPNRAVLVGSAAMMATASFSAFALPRLTGHPVMEADITACAQQFANQLRAFAKDHGCYVATN